MTTYTITVDQNIDEITGKTGNETYSVNVPKQSIKLTSVKVS
jgi:hypothetical protein